MRKDPKDVDIHAILNDLKEAVWHELPFQAVIKANFNEYTKEWYYGIEAGGAFSKKDINHINKMYQKHNIYYKFNNELLIPTYINYTYNNNILTHEKNVTI